MYILAHTVESRHWNPQNKILVPNLGRYFDSLNLPDPSSCVVSPCLVPAKFTKVGTQSLLDSIPPQGPNKQINRKLWKWTVEPSYQVFLIHPIPSTSAIVARPDWALKLLTCANSTRASDINFFFRFIGGRPQRFRYWFFWKSSCCSVVEYLKYIGIHLFKTGQGRAGQGSSQSSLTVAWKWTVEVPYWCKSGSVALRRMEDSSFESVKRLGEDLALRQVFKRWRALELAMVSARGNRSEGEFDDIKIALDCSKSAGLL